jgi:Ca2+-binding RTX toxin-like protein
MVNLVKHDLQFILKQIKVAEANSVAHSGDVATPLSELVSHHLLPYGLRTVNGSYNNLVSGHEYSGAADQIMPRLLDPVYVDGETAPAGLHSPSSPAGTTLTSYQNSGDVYDSDPRVISNLISDQTIGNPATIIAALTNLGHADPYKVLTGTNLDIYNDAVEAYKAYAAAEKALAQATANVTAKEMALARNPSSTDAQTALDAAKAVKESAQSAVTTKTEAKTEAYEALQDALGVTLEGDTVVIPNVAPDLGDTAPFNGFFTLFGQFFDHGLDLVSKGDNGTVYIPLQPDDPLYVPGSPTNFMVLTRATVAREPGADGVLNTDDDIVGQRNETTPWIDLNQVYTSNPSHQVFLREYVLVDGKPMATGHMLEGKNGGPPTWADVKEQAAAKLGIILADIDVLRVPAVLTDVYGEFVRGTNGFPQLVMKEGGPREASIEVGKLLIASEAKSAGRAFLNDIAHNAVPGTVYDADGIPQTQVTAVVEADSDTDAGNLIGTDYRGRKLAYDNELLDKHVIVGDGRGNENIGLTSIHHVFHSEHNRMIEEIKEIALKSGDLEFLNEWLATNVTEMPGTEAEINALVWDGERLFQAARFSTEMVYQHLVFEEFARAIAPDVDPFLFSNTTTVDGAIVAEFAHVVYRFGHSMLTDSIDMISVGTDGSPVESEIGLIEAFLNPIAFAGDGMTPDDAAGAILRGMTRQVGNEIDEHLTDALRNNLVGLPLDLGAVNIARARETGVPSLNEARKQFYADMQDTRLKPYDSWHDFALSLKNPASIVNFIAAYGNHASIKSAITLEAKRDAAMKLVFGGDDAPEDRIDFLYGQNQYSDTTTGKLGGLNDVDFWIGGLAEKKMTFGSMLGSTFTYVFEYQMEQLQAGDRFYYLSRTQGLNLLNELEADSFAQLIMRNTSLGDDNSTHVNGSAFQTADHILEMDEVKQIGDDPEHSNPVLQAISPMVIRKDLDGDGNADYLRYTGLDHAVLGGSNRDDILIGGEGDDTLWGGSGNDSLEGGYGVDHLHGGNGDDIITDSGTDIGAADVIHGDAGNDVINPGSGLDLVFGGSGQDFIYGGTEAKTVSAGLGNDFVRGSTGISTLAGNEGDDWIEGGESFDSLAGENSELFFNSTIIGHDVLNGRGNDTDYDAESGDDVMFQNEGIERSNGMAGFDWAIHKGYNQAADSDMTITIFQNQQNNILRDRFDLVEGLSGWKYDDKLTGRDVVTGAYDENGNATQVEPGAPLESYSNALLQKNLHLIDGLADLVAHLERSTVIGADGKTETIVMGTGDASDVLLGGAGSDTIKGGGGNDIIDGDKWLNVRIRIQALDAQRNPVLDGNGKQVYYTTDGMDGKVYLETDYVKGEVVQGATAQFGGKTLQQTMFDRTLNPGQLSIVREIVDGDLNNRAKDVAVYGDLKANYTFTGNADGSITVEHVNVTVETDPTTGKNRISDGTDRLFNIETLRFADGDVNLTPPELKLRALDNLDYRDNFNTASHGNTNGTTNWGPDWIETNDNVGVTGGQIQIDAGGSPTNQLGGTNQLRFVGSNNTVNPANGAEITRSVNLAGAQSVTISFDADPNNLDEGENVQFLFAADGVNFVLLETIGGNGGNQTYTFDLGGPFSADARIRFAGTSMNANNEGVNIDNLIIQAVVPDPNASVDIETTFTEDLTAVAIADGPSIVEDSGEIVSARVILTNAQAGDVLTAPTNLPGNITRTIDTSVPGQITMILTGVETLANYQAAIQAIRFENTSENPSIVDRIIQVTVNDGFLNSNVATTTVDVVAVNDAPNAVNDSVITNITLGSSIVIPTWVLLANDTDVDSPSLDITGVSGATGGNDLGSLSLSGGLVSFVDTGTAGGNFNYNLSDGVATRSGTVTVSRDASADGIVNDTTINGSNILVGSGSGNSFDGGTGNDIIFAGGGDDTIVWNANNNGATDGRDFVDGGAGTLDRFVVTGSIAAETFVVYARAEAIAAGITGLKADTEIVITRTVGGTTSVIAELDNIEEITINTSGGNDIVRAVGNFNPTSLNFNTITINGDEGDDTVDITPLQSAHRILFRSNGGNDTIIGTLRQQDVIELPAGTVPTDYKLITTDVDGVTTMSDGSHSIRFTSSFTSKDKLPAQFMPGTGTGTETGSPGTGTETGAPGTGTGTETGAPGTGTGTETGAPGTETPSTGTPATSVISGTAGNDVITGTAKNDILSGGEGNDVIDGGSGTDTVLLVGRDRADYSIRFENGNAVFTHRNGGSDGVDTIANVEMIRFTGPDLRAEATLERLYDSILDRAADPAGKSEWLKAHANGMSMHDIAEALIGSAEAGLLHGDMSNEKYVDTLYQSALDRPADQGGLLGWTSALDSGSVDRADVLLSFTNSAEKLASSVIEFDFNQSEAATLVRLYDTVFDRRPDQAGINDWLTANENGMSMHDIALGFIGSAEAQMFRGDMNDEEYVDMLYQGALGRSAEAEGRAHWVNYLQNGGDRADALLSFANSAEKMDLIGVVSTSIDTL